jgi:hypothetical protein
MTAHARMGPAIPDFGLDGAVPTAALQKAHKGHLRLF